MALMALLPRLTTLLLLSCTLQLTIGLSISVPREPSDTIILKCRDAAVSGDYNISIEFSLVPSPLSRPPWVGGAGARDYIIEFWLKFYTVDSDSNGSNIDVEFWPRRTLPITALVCVPLHHASELVLNSEGNFFYGTNVSTEKVRPCFKEYLIVCVLSVRFMLYLMLLFELTPLASIQLMRLCRSTVYRSIDLVFDLGVILLPGSICMMAAGTTLGLNHVIDLSSIMAGGILCLSPHIASKCSINGVLCQYYLGHQVRNKHLNNCHRPRLYRSILNISARNTGLIFNLWMILLLGSIIILLSMMAAGSTNHVTDLCSISLIVMVGGILCSSPHAASKHSINGVLSQYYQGDCVDEQSRKLSSIIWNNCHWLRLCRSRSNTYCIHLYLVHCCETSSSGPHQIRNINCNHHDGGLSLACVLASYPGILPWSRGV